MLIYLSFSLLNCFHQKSYVAVKDDGQKTPCLIHVYKSENEEIWKNTTTVLSFLSSDCGNDNIMRFLWSAKGKDVISFKKNKLIIWVNNKYISLPRAFVLSGLIRGQSEGREHRVL
jgi:hypothetical protein